MASKLDAARIATDSGGVAVIANGRTPGVLDRLFAGEQIGTLFVPKAGTRER
jgi:glutamate 5-kinase